MEHKRWYVTQRILLGLMLAAVLLLCGGALALGARQDGEHQLAFWLALAALVPACLLLPVVSGWITRLGTRKGLLLLAGVCFIVKLLWVLAVQVPPSGDYAVFWDYAGSLSDRTVIFGGRYLALFPHIYGYGQFLSLFVSVFGRHVLVALVLNVLLSVAAGCLLHQICLGWLGHRAAVSAFLLWIICPSQTIYNSLVLSEPLYTTLMLGFLLLVTRLEGRAEWKRPAAVGVAAGAGGGVLLRLIQGTRPIAAIWIVALALWLVCIRPWQGGRAALQLWGCFVGVLVLVYLLSGGMWNRLVAWRIGEEPSSTPGYSVLVGFNQASNGCWNQDDSALLFQYSGEPGVSAQWVQEQMMDRAVERITGGEIQFPHLFKEKLRVFLGGDDSCVSYASPPLRHVQLFCRLCNTFYYLLLLLAMAGAVRLWRRDSRSPCTMAAMYVLGLTLAQMLVEVAGRYHYSILPFLILLALSARFPPPGKIVKSEQ